MINVKIVYTVGRWVTEVMEGTENTSPEGTENTSP